MANSKILCTFAPAFERMHNKVDPLAQLVEHNTFNVGVLGSSPKRITKGRDLRLFLLFWQGLSPKGSLTKVKASKLDDEPQTDHERKRPASIACGQPPRAIFLHFPLWIQKNFVYLPKNKEYA